jgi:hypothetical protein
LGGICDKGSKVQGFKGSRVQGFKGSRVQGFKNLIFAPTDLPKKLFDILVYTKKRIKTFRILACYSSKNRIFAH